MKSLKVYLLPWRIFAGIVLSAMLSALLLTAIAHSQTPTISPMVPVPVTFSKEPVPVSFSLPISVTVAWVISIATGLASIAIIWKFISKASAIITDLNRYGPVLINIAKEFKSDSGSSLRDAINRIEKSAAEAKAAAIVAQATSDNLTKLVVQIPKSGM